MKETRNLEYKEKVTNTFLKTVSAYANYGGGVILFGISDAGEKIGVADPKQTCLDIENRINDSIKPRPDYTLAVEGKAKVIKLTVEEGLYKPYLYKGKAYKRNDTATIEIEQEELKILILEGKNLNFEELPCQDDALSFASLSEKLREYLGITSFGDDVIRTLGLVTENGHYNNAAALLADENSFPGIDIVRFGESINEILDRETCRNQSILNQYDTAVRQYRKYYQIETIDGIDRKTRQLIPENAFREAVANALIHRLWNNQINIQIGMYEDRIEVTSPGGLPRGITREEYLHGNISHLRNPIIGMVFYRLKYIEMFGTGIRRIMSSYTSYHVTPEFKIFDSSITIVLPTLTRRLALTRDEETIYQFFTSGRLLSSSEISESCGFKKDKTIRLLNSMLEKNYIKRSGEGRGTKYSLR